MSEHNPESETESITDAQLVTVYLLDDFKNDHCVIKYNEREVFSDEAVSTNYAKGMARKIDIPLELGLSVLEVEIINRKIAGRLQLQCEQSIFIGVNIAEGEVIFTISDTFFRFM